MAIDAFIKFDGGQNKIEGESQDSALSAKDKWSALGSVTFGQKNTANIGPGGSGAGSGKVEFDDFSITKPVDASSPAFFQAICAGDHYDAVTIAVRKAGSGKDKPGDPYLQYKFVMVFVTSISTSVDTSGEAPTETITFAYGAMQVQYSQQDKGGKIINTKMTQWSRVQNQASLAV